MQISGKAVQNSWIKNVQKNTKDVFAQKSKKSTKVIQIFIDKFCTKLLFNYHLLGEGFAHFPHRTTITTTIFNNKEVKINF